MDERNLLVRISRMMLTGLLAGTFYIGDAMSLAATISDLSIHASRHLSSLSKHYLGIGYRHALLKSLHTIQEGHGPDALYIFWDPNCVYCHMLYEMLKNNPAVWEKLTVHWVPVGVIKPTSMAKAATVIAGGMPALRQDESQFNRTSESGGAAVSTNPKTIAEAKENTAVLIRLMSEQGTKVIATPTLWYPQGHWIKTGVPPSLAILLAALKHTPESGDGRDLS